MFSLEVSFVTKLIRNLRCIPKLSISIPLTFVSHIYFTLNCLLFIMLRTLLLKYAPNFFKRRNVMNKSAFGIKSRYEVVSRKSIFQILFG
jgi:hypothetical protein